MTSLTIAELQQQSHATALEKGWWDDGDRNIGELLCLMHSEVSEAFEEYRNGRDPQEVYFREDGKPEGIPIELADILIRIGDFCGRHEIDLSAAVESKLAFNRKRPYRHGGKRA